LYEVFFFFILDFCPHLKAVLGSTTGAAQMNTELVVFEGI